MDQIIKNRNEFQRKSCLEINKSHKIKNKTNTKEFVINNKYKVIWCNVFKSASSTWIYHFLLMAGFKKEDLIKSKKNAIEILRTNYPRPDVTELNKFHANKEYKSFIIVREPFHRLLSAYFDKIQSPSQLFFEKLRCQIIKEFGNREFKKPCMAYFSEFVDYIIKEREKGNRLNEHWTPYHSFCSTCSFKFDYILKFENLLTEEQYLIGKVNIFFNFNVSFN